MRVAWVDRKHLFSQANTCIQHYYYFARILCFQTNTYTHTEIRGLFLCVSLCHFHILIIYCRWWARKVFLRLLFVSRIRSLLFWLDLVHYDTKTRSQNIRPLCNSWADALMSLILLFYGSENAPKRCDNDDDNGVKENSWKFFWDASTRYGIKASVVVAALEDSYAYNKQHIKISEHFLNQTKLDTSTMC